MDQGNGLFADCADHLGMRVSKQVERDPGDKVEILATRFVVYPASPTAHERDWQAAPGLHQVSLGQLERGLGHGAHGVTIVPMPASVKSWSRSACVVRPSTMCARGTPSRARGEAPRFGIR